MAFNPAIIHKHVVEHGILPTILPTM